MADLPDGVALCLNAGPETMVSAELHKLLADCETGRVVMELTEQAKVDDYPRLSGALDDLHLLGVRLAIDDTGAGFASLAHILKLSPDLIKLDRELTSGIDDDPVRIALATALVSFASGLGADIIAEGIETPAELDILARARHQVRPGLLPVPADDRRRYSVVPTARSPQSAAGDQKGQREASERLRP